MFRLISLIIIRIIKIKNKLLNWGKWLLKICWLEIIFVITFKLEQYKGKSNIIKF